MVEYEELTDVIVEAIEKCDGHRLCDGCKYDAIECIPITCRSMLIADNILKHYELKEKQND